MKYWIASALGVFALQANAQLAETLEGLAGYSIVESKAIKGWYDADGVEETAFKGCKTGRTIVFADNQTLTCADYGYDYAYRPNAVILVKNPELSYDAQSLIADYKMIVGDAVYQMRP